MPDNFFLSGLKDSGWFGQNFEQYHLFGYVGDRQRLEQYLQRKSILRRIIEIVVPTVNIGSIFNALSGFNLLSVDPDKTLATKIINLVTERETHRTLTEWLQHAYKRARKEKLYFDGVSSRLHGENRLFDSDFNKIQDRLVTVEGQLVHRETIAQYSRGLNGTLRASEGEWVLSDYPPHALVDQNERFDGKVLLIREDPGFTRTFGDFLPFARQIGWYPYIRLTGFFDATRLQTEILPTISLAFVEYRRPRMLQEVNASLKDFVASEVRKAIYLDDLSDWVLFSYLPPLLFKGSNRSTEDANISLTTILREYSNRTSELPDALKPFYAALPDSDAGAA